MMDANKSFKGIEKLKLLIIVFEIINVSNTVFFKNFFMYSFFISLCIHFLTSTSTFSFYLSYSFSNYIF